MIDADGFRPNVGIILTDRSGRVLLAKRVGQDSWQFPQGGIMRGESIDDAMYRELEEELGLRPDHVEIVGRTRGWLRYRLPRKYIRRNQKPRCIGQKQKWFLLRFIGDEDAFRLDAADKPEFDGWRWVDYWYPMEEVIYFKRRVYEKALKHFESMVTDDGVPDGAAADDGSAATARCP